MSTRSSITVKIGNEYHSIYCHFDGCLSFNGKRLLEYYNSQEKAESLVELGDLSYLGKYNTKPKGHSFDTPVSDCCVYYGRDRGETDVDPIVADKYETIMERNIQEYNYLFKNGNWYVDSVKGDLELLTKEMVDDKE